MSNLGKFDNLFSIIAEIETNRFPNPVKRNLFLNFPHKKLLKLVLFLTYSPTCIFTYVEKLFSLSPAQKKTLPDHKKFLILKMFEKLHNGNITLNVFQDKIQDIFEKNPPTKTEIEFYNRIIRKNLGFKVTIEMINSIFPGLIYNPIEFQLASDYIPNNQSELDFPVFIEPIYSGVRLKMFASPSGESGVYSRGYINYNNLFSSHLEILKELSTKYGTTIEVDGELKSKDWPTTAKIMDQSNRGIINQELVSKVKFHIFDVILFSRKKMALRLRKRKYAAKIATKMINFYPTVKLIPHKEVHSQDELLRCYEIAVKKGFSGIMIKDPKAPYYPGRKSGWLKMESIHRLNLPVVGFLDDNHILCEHQNTTISIPLMNGFQCHEFKRMIACDKTLFGEFISNPEHTDLKFVSWRQDKAMVI